MQQKTVTKITGRDNTSRPRNHHTRANFNAPKTDMMKYVYMVKNALGEGEFVTYKNNGTSTMFFEFKDGVSKPVAELSHDKLTFLVRTMNKPIMPKSKPRVSKPLFRAQTMLLKECGAYNSVKRKNEGKKTRAPLPVGFFMKKLSKIADKMQKVTVYELGRTVTYPMLLSMSATNGHTMLLHAKGKTNMIKFGTRQFKPIQEALSHLIPKRQHYTVKSSMSPKELFAIKDSRGADARATATYVKRRGPSPYDGMEHVPEPVKPYTNTFLNATVSCNGQNVQQVLESVRNDQNRQQVLNAVHNEKGTEKILDLVRSGRESSDITETSQMIREAAEEQFVEHLESDYMANKTAYDERVERREAAAKRAGEPRLGSSSAKLDARNSRNRTEQKRIGMYVRRNKTKTNSRPKKQHAFGKSKNGPQTGVRMAKAKGGRR